MSGSASPVLKNVLIVVLILALLPAACTTITCFCLPAGMLGVSVVAPSIERAGELADNAIALTRLRETEGIEFDLEQAKELRFGYPIYALKQRVSEKGWVALKGMDEVLSIVKKDDYFTNIYYTPDTTVAVMSDTAFRTAEIREALGRMLCMYLTHHPDFKGRTGHVIYLASPEHSAKLTVNRASRDAACKDFGWPI